MNATITEAPVNSLSFLSSFACAISNPLALKNPKRKNRTVKEVIVKKNAKMPYPAGPKALVLIIPTKIPKNKAII